MTVLETVKQIVVDAGRLLIEKEKDKEVFRKDSRGDKHDVVTSVDFAVEKFICERLKDVMAGAQIFTEETDFSDVTSEYFWAIDPIDGTKNFAAGIPLVGISVGLLRYFAPVLGVILNPYTGELYHAEKSKGAFRNGEQIRVSGAERVSDCMVILEGKEISARNREYARRLTADARTIRNFGCATLNLTFLAEGRVQAYIDEDLKYYDIAAGAVILEEAGGKMTNVKGKPIFPRKPDFNDIDVVASNDKIHSILIEYISKG
jgi:myo-inositol-1(or 4)-monophosphatase